MMSVRFLPLLVLASGVLVSTLLAQPPSGLGTGVGKSRRSGAPGHWPSGTVWVAAGERGSFLGYHLERRDFKVPAGAVPSPDGQRIAWHRISADRVSLQIGPLPEGPWKTVWEGAELLAVERPRWTRSGEAICFAEASPKGAVFHVIPVGSPRGGRHLPAEAGDVSPDGAKAAITRKGELLAVDLASGKEHTLYQAPDGNVTTLDSPRFSPDGQRVLAVEIWRAPSEPADQLLLVFDMAGGRPAVLAPRLGTAATPR
jgi:hypothetical protein